MAIAGDAPTSLELGPAVLDPAAGVAEPPAEPPVVAGGRTGSLRRLAARGTLTNAGFDIAFATLGAIKGFVVAGLLSRSDYGVWGVIVLSVSALYMIRDVGVGSKYVQQSEPDQELAFQRAFTIEAILAAAFLVVLLAAIPVLAVAYGQHAIVAPLLVVATMVPAAALYSPLWIFYRRMQFVHQRALQSIEPVVTFVVTIVLAIGGAGYWSLVLGALAGTWTTAIAAALACPYRFALRYDAATLRSYLRFSGPLFASGASRAAVLGGTVLAGTRAVGLAGIGSITLASSITQYTNSVDSILTTTLYPAICAARDRAEVLFESFVKSNRLTLMWGLPFGVGLALFASDLVRFGLGARWQPAVVLLEIFGLIAAVNHVGFNWPAYFQARDETGPIAVVSLATALAFLVTGLPLLFVDGLAGFGFGMAFSAAVSLVLRGVYLSRLFSAPHMLRHGARAAVPTLVAATVALGLRLGESGHRRAALAVAELAVYVVVAIAATWSLERPLLREALGYLRRERGEPAPA